MGRKIILNLAISMDGFIADANNGFDWIYGDGNRSLDTAEQWSYENFLDEVDTVIMGHQCYRQNFHKAFSEKKVYVAARNTKSKAENVHFIEGDLSKFLLEEMKQDGKNIFLFGGGITIDPFIKANLIDEYILSIVPIVLGNGHPLFLDDNPRIRLYLEKYYINSGIVTLHYKRGTSL